MTQRTLALLAVLACTEPKLRDFSVPKSAEDVRGRLLPLVEGHPVPEALDYMSKHGAPCDPPLPSATDARVYLCHPADRKWSIELYERNSRIADVQAR
jgi:hypothetical protein